MPCSLLSWHVIPNFLYYLYHVYIYHCVSFDVPVEGHLHEGKKLTWKLYLSACPSALTFFMVCFITLDSGRDL